MPIMENRSPLARGFTLLEVLMVVLVVGILSAVVLISMNPGGPERRLEDEAERLASLLELAGNEAVMQNREYGLLLEEDGYRFLCLDDGRQQWQECTGDSLFKPHTLPEGLEARTLDESRVTLPTTTARSGAPDQSMMAGAVEKLSPDILLLSSGEASPAVVEIRVTEEPSLHIPVSINEIGRVRWGEQVAEEKNHAK